MYVQFTTTLKLSYLLFSARAVSLFFPMRVKIKVEIVFFLITWYWISRKQLYYMYRIAMQIKKGKFYAYWLTFVCAIFTHNHLHGWDNLHDNRWWHWRSIRRTVRASSDMVDYFLLNKISIMKPAYCISIQTDIESTLSFLLYCQISLEPCIC